MNQIADKMHFPATPEEMYRMMSLEDGAKREHMLTHVGLNGYIITDQAMRMRMDRALYGFSAVDMTTGERVDPTKITPAWD